MISGMFSRRIINEYLPGMSSLCGVKEFEYTTGAAKGVRALEVYTGSGFRFTVLPDRGLDISEASMNGIPVSWVGKQGIFAPSYFQNGNSEFFKMFFGGLLTTCGLIQAGAPCTDESVLFGREEFGLHGRINSLPAENYGYDCRWENDDYIITVSGSVREARMYGENLVRRRTIETRLGARELKVHDEVINEGHIPTELMMLYHINFGYPLLSENSKLETNYRRVEAINDFAKEKGGYITKFARPKAEYLNDNYRLYDPDDDNVKIALYNEISKIGAEVLYSDRELPFCTEWLNMAAQDYVLGIEPGNCLPEGRVMARKNNRLDVIEPEQIKSYNLTIRILN